MLAPLSVGLSVASKPRPGACSVAGLGLGLRLTHLLHQMFAAQITERVALYSRSAYL